jgi:hypothetical protein
MKIKYAGKEIERADNWFGFDIQEWDEADYAIFLTLFTRTHTWFLNKGTEPIPEHIL